MRHQCRKLRQKNLALFQGFHLSLWVPAPLVPSSAHLQIQGSTFCPTTPQALQPPPQPRYLKFLSKEGDAVKSTHQSHASSWLTSPRAPNKPHHAQTHTHAHPSVLGTVASFLRQHVRDLHRILNSCIKQLLLWQEKINLSLPFQQVPDFVWVLQGYFG